MHGLRPSSLRPDSCACVGTREGIAFRPASLSDVPESFTAPKTWSTARTADTICAPASNYHTPNSLHSPPPPGPPRRHWPRRAVLHCPPGDGGTSVAAWRQSEAILVFYSKRTRSRKDASAQVRAVKDADAEQYEKAIASGQFLEILLAEGSLPNTWDETDEVRRLALEEAATSALLKVIQETQIPQSKKDLLICGRALEALGKIGLAAKEAIPILEDLRKHRALAVSVKASVGFRSNSGRD